jgi:bifunctional UDP-N-acetylglucosamine pyrophosphorylase/glucosamine-1-phosphate N-acetyltransferase
MIQRAAVILAAGQGTRMRSPVPKVLHKVGGRTMLDRAIDAAEALGCARIVVVAGAHSPEVAAHARKRLGDGSVAIQDPPLGTGHAVRAAEGALEGFVGDVLITYADCPLLGADAVEPLFGLREQGAAIAVLGFEAADPAAYGRLIVGFSGSLSRIVEAKDATADELKIRACNSGVMVAPVNLLFGMLAEVKNENAKGEYYLTDVVGLARERGFPSRVAFAPEEAVMGVNSQGELAEAEAAFQRRRRTELMVEGVTLSAPETVHVAFDTQIAPGVRIEPYVVFGPGVTVETGAEILAFSHLEGAHVGPGARVGPYARLRPGARIGEKAHVGNFVEIKNVDLGAGAKANHLSYLGDGQVGAGANLGAGAIFCNYDGFGKHRTVVGEGAFVGSNSALVAPVTIGDGAFVGSGSVITRDVQPDALALGRGQQVDKPGWAKTFRDTKRAEKAEKSR